MLNEEKIDLGKSSNDLKMISNEIHSQTSAINKQHQLINFGTEIFPKKKKIVWIVLRFCFPNVKTTDKCINSKRELFFDTGKCYVLLKFQIFIVSTSFLA